jgi:hypothetical protein
MWSKKGRLSPGSMDEAQANKSNFVMSQGKRKGERCPLCCGMLRD